VPGTHRKSPAYVVTRGKAHSFNACHGASLLSSFANP